MFNAEWKRTTLSLFGKDATSFSHLDLGILCHSSLQILSSSVRLDGKRWWTAIFRSLQRCSIGFKSGLWLGHSRTVTELLWSHSFVILAVCLGSLSCWKVNLRPSLRSWALWRRFSSRISLYLAAFIFPSIATSRPVPAAEKHPHSMMLPPPCFTLLGLYWTGDEQCLVFLHTYRLELRPKSSILVSSDQRILQVFFSKLHAGFHVSCTEERLPSGHSAIKPRLVRAAVMVWLSTTFSHLPNASLELSHSDLGFFFTSLTKASSPPIAQFGRTASSRKGSGRPKRLPFKDYGGTVLLGTLSAAEFFCNLGQICALPQFCLWALQAVPLTSWFSFALTCTVSCKVLYRQVCGFPNQVQSV